MGREETRERRKKRESADTRNNASKSTKDVKTKQDGRRDDDANDGGRAQEARVRVELRRPRHGNGRQSVRNCEEASTYDPFSRYRELRKDYCFLQCSNSWKGDRHCPKGHFGG